MSGQEAAEKKLHDAASKGDITTLGQLLQQDPNLLDRVSSTCWNRSPLHTATQQGNLEFVEEVLKINPQLARITDYQKSSPLHIAAAEGKIEISSKLLSVAPEMCWRRDDQGMNPAHIAAINGHVGVLEKLLEVSVFPAMERLHRGQTVLHLCVKHRQYNTLRILLDKLGEMVCAKDDEGDTILHSAVRCNTPPWVMFFLTEGAHIDIRDTRNSLGKKALDILNEISSPDNANYPALKGILMKSSKRSMLKSSKRSMLKALPKLSDTTMVVVVLIATMAFQAALSPPGGVWQDDTPSHKAGDAVMASTHPKLYKHFVRANTTAFASALITIFLITTRQPSGRIFFLLIAMYATWVSLASIAVSYGASVMAITPNTGKQSLAPVIIAVAAVSSSIMVFIWVSSLIRRLYLSWKSRLERGEDLTNDSVIQRAFYFIFQLLDLGENSRLETILGLVVRPSAHTPIA